MAKKKQHHRTSQGVSIAMVAGLTPGLISAYNGARAGGLNGAASSLALSYTGYDLNTRTWSLSSMLTGWTPIIAGMLVHKIVGGMLGVNKILARSKIPFIRV